MRDKLIHVAQLSLLSRQRRPVLRMPSGRRIGPLREAAAMTPALKLRSRELVENWCQRDHQQDGGNGSHDDAPPPSRQGWARAPPAVRRIVLRPRKRD